MTSNKIKISVRLNPYNYDLIRAIADVAFRDEDEYEGNFSEAIDFLLTILRLDSNFSGMLKFLSYKARFDRGERSSEVIDGVRHAEKLINIIKNLTN